VECVVDPPAAPPPDELDAPEVEWPVEPELLGAENVPPVVGRLTPVLLTACTTRVRTTVRCGRRCGEAGPALSGGTGAVCLAASLAAFWWAAVPATAPVTASAANAVTPVTPAVAAL
jgi:hypothetical protein